MIAAVVGGAMAAMCALLLDRVGLPCLLALAAAPFIGGTIVGMLLLITATRTGQPRPFIAPPDCGAGGEPSRRALR
ncbi:hypothetical protein [Parafrankia sp. BMG5.11]|uniref:hypothetical protein n=2 Tax=unclassified Parafrankia TaxID=2994368 RepID=UPI000DA55218|nr:hypothetical protein [Parafrankia sp. BMG5.11]SQD96693.1 hypothetical protein FMEAI12_3740008 [Parafrankia sp. Ea1.12]